MIAADSVSTIVSRDHDLLLETWRTYSRLSGQVNFNISIHPAVFPIGDAAGWVAAKSHNWPLTLNGRSGAGRIRLARGTLPPQRDFQLRIDDSCRTDSSGRIPFKDTFKNCLQVAG